MGLRHVNINFFDRADVPSLKTNLTLTVVCHSWHSADVEIEDVIPCLQRLHLYRSWQWPSLIQSLGPSQDPLRPCTPVYPTPLVELFLRRGWYSTQAWLLLVQTPVLKTASETYFSFLLRFPFSLLPLPSSSTPSLHPPTHTHTHAHTSQPALSEAYTFLCAYRNSLNWLFVRREKRWRTRSTDSSSAQLEC